MTGTRCIHVTDEEIEIIRAGLARIIMQPRKKDRVTGRRIDEDQWKSRQRTMAADVSDRLRIA